MSSVYHPSATQSVVKDQQQRHLGTCLKGKFGGPTLDLHDQKLLGVSQESLFNKPPGELVFRAPPAPHRWENWESLSTWFKVPVVYYFQKWWWLFLQVFSVTLSFLSRGEVHFPSPWIAVVCDLLWPKECNDSDKFRGRPWEALQCMFSLL